jgi:galactose mutarotase-like enzyme
LPSTASHAISLHAYPWQFESRLTYALISNALRIEFQVRNASDAPMPFAFGLHPYFIVRDKAAARIPTSATRAFDNVAKQIVPFRGFDLPQGEVDMHLLDHGSTRGVLELGDGTSIEIDASPEFVRWIVWTVAGKDYVCLEPWTASGNALNTGEELIVLPSGESRAMWVEIRVAAGTNMQLQSDAGQPLP